jgi:hypothetical protein
VSAGSAGERRGAPATQATRRGSEDLDTGLGFRLPLPPLLIPLLSPSPPHIRRFQ